MKINVVGCYILNDNVNCANFNERKGECITKIPKVIPNCTQIYFFRIRFFIKEEELKGVKF